MMGYHYCFHIKSSRLWGCLVDCQTAPRPRGELQECAHEPVARRNHEDRGHWSKTEENRRKVMKSTLQTDIRLEPAKTTR